MTNTAASNAGVGRAVFATRLKLTLKAIEMSFWFGFIPTLALVCITWLSLSNDQDVDMAKIGVMVHFANPDRASRWYLRDAEGVRKVVVGKTPGGREYWALKPQQVRQVLDQEWGKVRRAQMYGLAAVFLPMGGFALVMFLLIRLGRSNMEDQRVRGAEDIVSAQALNTEVLKRGAAPYKLAEVRLPANAPMAGILMQGAQGSGKSLAIHDLMQQAFRRQKKCIIYDQSGEFYRAYFRPGKDFFFNPALVGSVPWSIFSEMKYAYDADTLSHAFLPPKAGVVHGASAFFEDAARALFSVMLLRLAKYGAVNTRDIANAIFELPDAEMEKLIEKSIASSAVGGDSKGQRQGVISSIAIYLNGIRAVQPGNWSIREFLDAPGDGRFFILGTDDTRAMFSPLYRLILASSFAMISAKQEVVHDDRFWFFLDEVHTLGDIKLDEQLATLRKFGVSIVSGIQSESQFWTSMGKDRGDTVMNCFNTVLMLRMNEPSMMERAAKRLGRVEIDIVSQNQALAVNEARDGAGVNIQEREKWLVMPSAMGDLKTCEGYLKVVGGFPAAKVNYSHWLPSRLNGGGYVKRFAPIQAVPERDPAFLIERQWEAGSVNPLTKVGEAAAASAADGVAPDGGIQKIDTTTLEPESFLMGTDEHSEAVMVSLPGQPNKQQMEMKWYDEPGHEVSR